MAFDPGARRDSVQREETGLVMLSKKSEEKIQKLRQELNQLANQLIQRSPEGQRIAGQIEAYEAMVVDLRVQDQELFNSNPRIRHPVSLEAQDQEKPHERP